MATARPIPREAPVTMTALPSSSMVHLLKGRRSHDAEGHRGARALAARRKVGS
jgi:hypothetical protein